jgi:TPP-dependent pyruvate/acetoin dehydrogenase alpha subunit
VPLSVPAAEWPTTNRAYDVRIRRASGAFCASDALLGAFGPAEELARWKARDPLPAFRAHVEAGLEVPAAELDRIERRERDLIEDAVAFAEASPAPEPFEALEDVYSERSS